MSSSSEQPSKLSKSPRKDATHSGSVDAQGKGKEASGPKRGKNSKLHANDTILLHRPQRPKPAKPAPPPPEDLPLVQTVAVPEVPTVEPEPVSTDTLDIEQTSQQPIPPPSEPMQYRAIGLVKGQYLPSQDQFNRGVLMTEDGTPLDAVLLGQVMSLVKKYLDLSRPYLWVVYPRTRDKQETLHIQIVGVWSEEGFGTLNTDEEDADEANVDLSQSSGNEAVDDPSLKRQGTLAPPLEDGYFSIRGQVVFQSPEKEFILVKIQQAPRKNSDKPRMFKLKLIGTLEGQNMGYFYDFHVRRDSSNLVIKDAKSIAMVPLKKQKRKKPTPGGARKRIDGAPKPAPAAAGPGGLNKKKRSFERPIKRNTPSSEA